VFLGGVGWALRFGPLVGGLALGAYLLIFGALGSNPLAIFSVVGAEQAHRGLAFSALGLASVATLNLGLGLAVFGRGARLLLDRSRAAALGVALGVAPQLLLPFVAPEFVTELGSGLLVLFWACCAPIGVALAELPRRWSGAVLASWIALALALWLLPDRLRGLDQVAAGAWLRGQLSERTLLVGSWNPGVGVAAEAFDYDLRALESRFLNVSSPDEGVLSALEADTVFILSSRPSWVRELAARVPIAGFELRSQAPLVSANGARLEALPFPGSIEIHRWSRGAGAAPDGGPGR
jgi:hypothetical protein